MFELEIETLKILTPLTSNAWHISEKEKVLVFFKIFIDTSFLTRFSTTVF